MVEYFTEHQEIVSLLKEIIALLEPSNMCYKKQRIKNYEEGYNRGWTAHKTFLEESMK